MNVKNSFLTAISLAFVFISLWEVYWRSQDRVPTIDDDKHLWAQERAKIDNLGPEDVILIGSSRVLFNIQIKEFTEKTGRTPIQLACAGSSPLPVFHDIVENTDFTGTVIVGVTPPLFFSTTFPEASPIKWPQTRVDHFQDRSLSDRLGHFLSLPLQENLVFLGTFDDSLDDNVDLKTLLHNIEINDRTDNPRYPPFFDFGKIDRYRNVAMTNKTSTDTAAANIIKNAWKVAVSAERPPPDKNGTTDFFASDVRKFKERGGKAILLRSPSTGFFKTIEAQVTPRASFYDSLVQVTGLPGYHYSDYPQLNGYDCPEWSHLSAEDARKFTLDFAQLLIDEGHISPLKNQ